MKIVRRFATEFEYRVLQSRYVHHADEDAVRPAIPGTVIRFHESVLVDDIIALVCLGAVCPVFPSKFKAKTLRPLSLRVGQVKQAIPAGEIVEVLGDEDTAKLIAYRQLSPIDPDIWTPDRTTVVGRLKGFARSR